MSRVLENGIRQTTSEVMEDTYDKYMRGSDPIGYFAEKVLVTDAASKVKNLDMFDIYEKFCLENGLALESEQSFSRKMRKDFGYEKKQLRDKGERPYFWIGVKITDWKQRELDEQSRLEEVSKYSPATQKEMI